MAWTNSYDANKRISHKSDIIKISKYDIPDLNIFSMNTLSFYDRKARI